jgi:ADP-ribose pyrophosphatase YjhB (NUDIX family)
VSVAAAVVNPTGQVLAIRRRDNGHWEPPGGVLELDETIHAGLVREVREETGLTVEPEVLTGVYKNMRRGIVALVFRCHIASGDLTLGHEAAEVRWLTPEQVTELMDEAYAARLLDALRPGPPAVRAPTASRCSPRRTGSSTAWDEVRAALAA